MFCSCVKPKVHPCEKDYDCAKVIWDYMSMGHALKKADLILGLGNQDLRTAEHAAELYLSGMGDKLMFSGKVGAWTHGMWDKPEAEVFKDVAVKMGVPEEKIILEKEATNTGENIRLSYELLREMEEIPRVLIIVQAPFMERRSYATFMKQWPLDHMDIPETHVVFSSPNIPLPHYTDENIDDFQETVAKLLITLKKIKEYPAKNFQIPQTIPCRVRKAYDYLKNFEQYNKYIR
ncbi:uncharacterized protein SCO4629-like [Liolophura sinensis]|uniref:uncharacterized protein SCO4629-like n=1 Tax=Liolophura sinensis TaxID=3198878 RepID=UPI0031586D50